MQVIDLNTFMTRQKVNNRYVPLIPLIKTFKISLYLDPQPDFMPYCIITLECFVPAGDHFLPELVRADCTFNLEAKNLESDDAILDQFSNSQLREVTEVVIREISAYFGRVL